MASPPSIFVSIISYRDPEAQYTIRDLFAQAARPGRVFVGIVEQYHVMEDEHCSQVETRPNQVEMRAPRHCLFSVPLWAALWAAALRAAVASDFVNQN